jgi:hypothetical protein
MSSNNKKKKTASQLRRLQSRAAARQQQHRDNEEEEEEEEKNVASSSSSSCHNNNSDTATATASVEVPTTTAATTATVVMMDSNAYEINSDDACFQVATRLQQELHQIAANTVYNSKERRSAKRKAEAIAMEQILIHHGPNSPIDHHFTSGDQLLQWYHQKIQQQQQQQPNTSAADDDTHHRDKRTKTSNEEATIEISTNTSKKKEKKKKPPHPYIVFVGQLSYETKAEDIKHHFYTTLIKDHPSITKQEIQVRLRTDPNTKKSLGMAFVEIHHHDPQILYTCFKLHQSYIHGRRINVEHTCGTI